MHRTVALLLVAPALLATPLATAAQWTAAPDRPLLASALSAARGLSLGGGAQTPDVWTQLQAHPSGTRVRLVLASGTEIEGRLVATRDDSVVVDRNQLLRGEFKTGAGVSLIDALTFQRADISDVRFPDDSRRREPPRNPLLRHPVLAGLFIGASAGALMGAASSTCAIEFGPPCPGISAAFYAGSLGGIGAGVGALVGRALK